MMTSIMKLYKCVLDDYFGSLNWCILCYILQILVSSYAAYIIFLSYDVTYALSYIHICILSNFFSNVFFLPAGVPLNFLGLGAGRKLHYFLKLVIQLIYFASF